ncbi:adenosine receptor A3-like [Haliotis cracherodii]|uniref:adenosine receptor A3-like n=1 Tax=Haliotis cracherodii TaxID=6455 RepID=UPI0039EB0529
MNNSYAFIAFTGSPVTFADLVGLPFLILMGITELVLNLIVLVALRSSQEDASNSFIVNLAMADALTGLIVIYNSVYTMLEWKDVHECLFRFGLLIGVNMASVLSIMLLTVDRYVKIKDPFRHKRLFTSKRVTLLNTSVWVLSLTVAILPVAGWNRSQEVKKTCKFFTVFSTSYLGTVVVIFVIPLVAIVTLYPQIYVLARKHAMAIHAQLCRTSSGNTPRSTLRFAKTVGIIIGMYILCWAPVGTYLLLVLLDRPLVEETGVDLGAVLTYTAGVGFLNSLINPLVYAIKIPAVGRVFRRVCCCCCCSWSDPAPSARHSVYTLASVGLIPLRPDDAR